MVQIFIDRLVWKCYTGFSLREKEVKMIKIKNEILQYIELTGLSSREFAEQLGMAESQVSRILNRKQEPSKIFIEKFMLQSGMKFESAFEIKA